MAYGERKNPIVFGGGQRSFGVTGGQSVKNFENMITQQVLMLGISYVENKWVLVLRCSLSFLVEIKGCLGPLKAVLLLL